MLGYLVACGGGKTVPLREECMFIGRRRDAASAAPDQAPAPLYELRLVDGVWTVRHLEGPLAVQVNGVQVSEGRLRPGDILTVGRSRYTIEYTAPTPADASPPAAPPAAVPSEPAPAPPEPDPAPFVNDMPPIDGVFGRLVPHGGGATIPLLMQRVTVGRNPTCDVVLAYKAVSGMHCSLEFVNGHWRFVDLGSQNGVRVNGVQYPRRWLMPGDRVSFARHAFRLEYTATGPRPSLEEDEWEAMRGGSLLQRAGIREGSLEASLQQKESELEPSRRRFQL